MLGAQVVQVAELWGVHKDSRPGPVRGVQGGAECKGVQGQGGATARHVQTKRVKASRVLKAS